MEIKDIIEQEFVLPVHSIIILGQGLDSIAYLVNHEYIFKQSKHDEARMNLKKEVQVLNYLKGKSHYKYRTLYITARNTAFAVTKRFKVIN